MSLVKYVD